MQYLKYTKKILLSWNSNVPNVLCFYFLNLATQSLCIFIHLGEWPLNLHCEFAFLRAVFPNMPVIRSIMGLVISRMLLWRFGFSGLGGCLETSFSNKTLTHFSWSALPSQRLREPCSHPTLPSNFLPIPPIPLFLTKSGVCLSHQSPSFKSLRSGHQREPRYVYLPKAWGLWNPMSFTSREGAVWLVWLLLVSE